MNEELKFVYTQILKYKAKVLRVDLVGNNRYRVYMEMSVNYTDNSGKIKINMVPITVDLRPKGYPAL